MKLHYLHLHDWTIEENDMGTKKFGLYEAIKLAKEAHHEQMDKIGKPYIHHPIAVMLMRDRERDDRRCAP